MPDPLTVIREAKRDDVPAIVALLADDPIAAGRETASAEPDQAYWRAFDAIESDPGNLLVVADRAGEVMGTRQLIFIPSLTRRGGERAEIEGVRVSALLAPYRRRRRITGRQVARAPRRCVRRGGRAGATPALSATRSPRPARPHPQPAPN